MTPIRCMLGSHDYDVVFSDGPSEDFTCVRCGDHAHSMYDMTNGATYKATGHSWNGGPSAYGVKGWESWILNVSNAEVQAGCTQCGCWYPAQTIMSRVGKDVPQPPCPKCGT